MRTLGFILLFISTSLLWSQTYSYRINTFKNGIEDPMKGVPGDIFNATVTFSNSSATQVFVFVNRFQKTIPADWKSCYCYTVCSDPATDTIRVNMEPFGTTSLTIQFATDTINPGIATSDFKIFQVDFPSNVSSFSLAASTINDVGIQSFNSDSRITIFPNPAKDQIKISGAIEMFEILDSNGKAIERKTVLDKKTSCIDISFYPAGIYCLKAVQNGKTSHSQFVKLNQ